MEIIIIRFLSCRYIFVPNIFVFWVYFCSNSKSNITTTDVMFDPLHKGKNILFEYIRTNEMLKYTGNVMNITEQS